MSFKATAYASLIRMFAMDVGTILYLSSIREIGTGALKMKIALDNLNVIRLFQ
jgi:hypothetical protein